MTGQIVYWSKLKAGEWNLYMAATAAGLCFTGSYDELAAWFAKRGLADCAVRDDEALRPYADQLAAYVNGGRKVFGFPVDLCGTPFQLSVWRALQDIPYGETCSYSDIAERIEKPEAVRAVGAAIGANPLLIAVPCHRVIGKNGKLTGYRGGLEMKKRLLALEKGYELR
ncbi:cysteine methyltransferase [Bacillus glycinifermentans]|uniref:Methylated-DNA--protein-cysteine methyltransferase n=1 Tax=Bacillus glycinifermentans TaxID=1664069 RepID=A0A0J6EHH2_9BACI|nr:methylated-DNA--[protein]-cysteine S-methyltransferase [Bacillus glycinifermentans]ATH92558.1 methylated-DNA--[protein]-cysteine S-methyltransferase [Bacillus glycinifermentans]KMM59921.1 cysteine methyltransferase [Bacillus glycinifermentans]KRT95307.1 cysteine methyltransferase [Bacillus glycinifermentans]MEC0486966.1 methylated-DNA--[protein]-cysteine S-methyltransferase [Bacillus glycinifermentans]MEC0493223.1 methylated-DNA--[protein]-cysteine S-methyltransferase [Bacillus glyciniferme